MPRKGGRVDLSDEEIIGAIEYMVEQVASERRTSAATGTR